MEDGISSWWREREALGNPELARMADEWLASDRRKDRREWVALICALFLAGGISGALITFLVMV